METKIIKQEKNPFLEREELVIELQGNIAPTSQDVKKATGKDQDLVVINRINSNFGRHTFTADVFVYDSVEAKKKIETIPKKVRKKIEDDEKKAAEEEAKKAQEEAKKAEETPVKKPAEEPKVEAPAQEPKENTEGTKE